MNRNEQSRYGESRGRDDENERRDREEWNEDAPRRSGFYPAGGYGFNPGEYEGSDRMNESERWGRPGGSERVERESRGGYGMRRGEYSDEGRGDYRSSGSWQGSDEQRSYGGGYGPGRGSRGRYSEHYGLARGGQREYDPDYRAGFGSERGEHYGLGRSGSYGEDYGSGRGQEGRYGGEQGRRGSALQRYRRGPKGYTRTDERIREDVSERLMSAYDIDSSEVSISVKDGKVTLEGTVPERRMKHAIEDIADGCSGVQDVDNRVRVSRETSGREWDAGSGAQQGGSTQQGATQQGGTQRGVQTASGTTEGTAAGARPTSSESGATGSTLGGASTSSRTSRKE
jgi:hypothetical protein